MQTLNRQDFLILKEEIEKHSRLSGYYIIDLVSISDLSSQGLSQEEILDRVFQYFDDQEWPPPSERPQDQSWEGDYQVNRESARQQTVEALAGGPSIGHAHFTMSQDVAESFWERFDSLFGQEKRYYTQMGLGLRDYAYSRGVSIADRDSVGILWIIEND
jgi:hypothetical protein